MKSFGILLIFFQLLGFNLFSKPISWVNKKEEILSSISNYEGWCSREKGELIADLIYENKPTLCVELGTFGGATLSVIAKTLQYNKHGQVISIDAYSNHEAIKGFLPDTQIFNWWGTVDLNQIHNSLSYRLKIDGLGKVCHVYKMTTLAALSLFPDSSIDFLYIDANHSENGFFSDVITYYPKVKYGGYILLNDAHWITARKSVIYLLECCNLCHSYHEGMTYLLFQKSKEVESISNQIWR